MSAEIETLHKPFASFLRSRGIEFINSRSDVPSTIEKGTVDFFCLHPQRPPLLIEFKDEGSLTKDQKKVHARLKERGFTPHVIRKLQVAIETVYQWLSDVRPEAPRTSPHSLFIHKVGDSGDHVVTPTGEIIRRATLADLGLYPRKQ